MRMSQAAAPPLHKSFSASTRDVAKSHDIAILPNKVKRNLPTDAYLTPLSKKEVFRLPMTIRNVDACLPIAAIQAIDFPDGRIVLQGQGPHVRLIDDKNGFLLANIRAFERNNVHGILVKKQSVKADGRLSAELLIWGGQSLQETNVTAWKSGTSIGASLASSSVEYEAPDWILDGDVCRDDSGNLGVCLITAHNALLFLDFKPASSQSGLCTIAWRELATGFRSILYSADVNWVSPKQVLVAAGTVFGEIIVWSCYLDAGLDQLSTEDSFIHFYFTGHEGSIFGVNISPRVCFPNEGHTRRFLASCSDDRTIRIWDISDLSRSPNNCSVQYAIDGLHHTGFGGAPSDAEMNTKCIAKTWAHSSRIWGVYFMEQSKRENIGSLSLVSRGEDSTCQLWSLDSQSNESRIQQFGLTHISTYCYHSGKNIWSLSICRELSQFTVYTGGADGSLVSFRIQDDPKHGAGCGIQRQRRDMNSLFAQDADASGKESVEKPIALTKKTKKETKKAGDVAKCYDFVADDCFLTISVRGDMRQGNISYAAAKSWNESNGSMGSESLITLGNVSSPNPIGGCPFAASIPNKGIAVVYGHNRQLQFYEQARNRTTPAIHLSGEVSGLFLNDCDPTSSYERTSNSTGLFAILVTYFNAPEVDLILGRFPGPEFPLTSPTRLILAEPIKVTSFLYIKEKNCVILGFRTGRLMIYRLGKQNDKPPTTSVHLHVHDDGTVRSIITVSKTSDFEPNKEFILSCGRNGTYCVHVLDFGPNEDGPVSFETVHRSSPPFGSYIEGAHFDKRTGDLILHGFRCKEFMVWNETAQTEVQSVECGGSNRIWAFRPRSNGDGAGTFVWTQASTFNMFSMEAPSHRVLRAGNHGREIKAVSVSNNIAGRGKLVATGAEDTTIRLFHINSSDLTERWGSFKCLRTLNKHTGGLQHLQWSPSGNFLFSSSGFEEFFVWKVRFAPGFGIGLVLEAICPKSNGASDLRIISFDLLEVDDTEGNDCFLLCLAYSNSTVNIFHYSSCQGTGKFTLLASGVYKTNCLTQIQFVKSGHYLSLITCATDGHAATWDLTDALSSFYTITEDNLKPQPRLLSPEEILPGEINWQHHHQIHQSSIKSMELAYQSGDEVLLICGGDDNALSVSRIHTGPSITSTKDRCSTLLIPKAHASAITGITIIPRSTSPSGIYFTAASSGNDQRLKIWSMSVDLGQSGVDGVGVIPEADKFSAVADISCLGHFSDCNGVNRDTTREKILVCGVGMELWDMNSQC